MTQIKAIETHYAGYRFRSRLEARWAVFFDVAGVKWRYEHEGYETSAGWYLPDFQVDPTHLDETIGELFFEVKGAELRQDEAERVAALVCDDLELRRCVIPLGQIPDPRKACPRMWEEMNGLTEWGVSPPDDLFPEWRAGLIRVRERAGRFSALMPVCNAFSGLIEAKRMAYTFAAGGSELVGSCHHRGDGYPEFCPHALTSPIGKALTAARSARFEHGESPKRP